MEGEKVVLCDKKKGMEMGGGESSMGLERIGVNRRRKGFGRRIRRFPLF